MVSLGICYPLSIFTILIFGLCLLVMITRALVEVIGFFMLYVYNRYMERTNGHLGSANKELVFSVALLGRIQCTLIVNALFLDKQAFQSSR